MRLKWMMAALLSAQLLQAQQVQRLTLQQAVELGMKNSKQLQLSAARADYSRTKYDQQLYATIPNLSIISGYTYNSPNIDESKFAFPGGSPQLVALTLHNQQSNRVSLSQVIFAGLRGWNIIASTKYQMQAAQLDAQKDQSDVKNNITTSFYNHYKLLESKKVVDKNIMVLEQRKKDMQNMEQVGMALKNDVLKVDIALLNLKQSAAEVQSAIDISNYNLAVALGLPEGSQIECVESGLFQAKTNAQLGAWVQNSIQNRTDLKALSLRYEASKKLLKASKGAYFPTINGSFNFYYSNPNQRVFMIAESERNKYFYSWDIGVNLNWNLTNLFTTTFQSREARANMRQAEAINGALSDGIKMEVNANYQAYKLALDKIDIAQRTVDQSTEDQRITKNQYDNGVRNITDMLDSDNALTRSQINLVNAKIDAEIAYSKLLKSSGN
ncbi:MAG: TolC family protein [Chitinophagales bacterium]